MRTLFLLLSTLFIALPAAAERMDYWLGAGSSLTLDGQSTQSLNGGLSLEFRGFCIGGTAPSNCRHLYDVAELSLEAEGFSVDFDGSLLPVGFVGAIPLVPPLGGNFPGPLRLSELAIDRGFGFDPFPGGFITVDTALRSAEGIPTPAALFGDDGFFPEAFVLELELIEVARQFVSSIPQPVSTTRTVIGTLRLDLRGAPPIPEPGSAVLYLFGLAVVARAAAPR